MVGILFGGVIGIVISVLWYSIISSNAPNLLYGQGSAAWSATITPTYQYERVFIRAELSYVQALNISQGMAFGPTGNSSNQTRVMFETGFLY